MISLILGLFLGLKAHAVFEAQLPNGSSALQQLVFEAVYARDGGTFHEYRERCLDELKKAEHYRAELLKSSVGRLEPEDLEVRAHFGELNGPGGKPEKVKCILRFFVTRSELSLNVVDSPTRRSIEQCKPFIEENIRNRKVFWQQMRIGWSFFQGDWCYVRAVEVLGI